MDEVLRLSDVVGHRWLLVETVADGRHIEHPPSTQEAWLDIHSAGDLSWFDGVNSASGQYVEGGASLVVQGRGMFTTLVGWSRADERQNAVLDAFHALIVLLNNSEPNAVLPMDMTGSLLRLRPDGHTMLFRRAGRIDHF